ncbi:Nucleic acid dioxygenase ALKBH1, partial [Taenia solium]
ALFDWPLDSSARNNIVESKIDSDLWLRSFLEFSNPGRTAQLLDRLRWITLGYHYDWDNKVYPPGCQSQFPSKCANFFKSIALTISEVIGDRQDLLTQRSYYDNFIPEASIVNYYRKKTTMGFHIDDSEICKRAPLISIR